MKKTLTKIILLAILLATTCFGFFALKAQGAEPASIAIVDSAFDTSLPIFNGRIAQEVCANEWSLCQYGQDLVEGPGSSTLDMKVLKVGVYNHGTQMASVIAKSDPNIKIVMIRTYGLTAAGNPTSTTDKSIKKAFDWIVANQSRYNIVSVAVSQGTHDINSFNNCSNSILISNIQSLKSVGVPVFLAAGNGYDLNRVDYPACISDAITIGSTDKSNTIFLYSNGTPPAVDFYANGLFTTTLPGGASNQAVGTSISTQIAALNWAKVRIAKPTYTYDQIYALIQKTATPTSNSKVKLGYIINSNGATNG